MQNSQVIAEGLTFIYAIPAEHLHNWHIKRVCKFFKRLWKHYYQLVNSY